MVSSRARTVKAYLKELPANRRTVVSKLRSVIRRRLPAGYQEAMNWGMIAYQVPLERYPETYNGEPLLYAAVAAQKRHYSLYLTSVYQQNALEKRLRAAFDRAGKKLDMGKSCIRFKTLEDLPMEAIGEIVGSVSVDQFLKNYEKARVRPHA
jgi:uncharacterized protein YdhG (YjbR/CyaY superfamily)